MEFKRRGWFSSIALTNINLFLLLNDKITIEDVLYWFLLWNSCLVMQRYVAFFYVSFVQLSGAVLLCLFKAPDWSNKELNTQ